MSDNPDKKTVYPEFGGRKSGAGGGDEPPSHDLIVKLVETKIEASEERVMRHVAEKTSQIEIDLSKQISSVSTQVSGITRSVIFATLGAGMAVLGVIYAVEQFVFDSSSRSFDIGQEFGSTNFTLQSSIEDNSDKIDELLRVFKKSNENDEPETSTPSE